MRNISVFVLELRRFSKLEFRNSVSLRAHLYGKFIEAYKYIVYCSYVLACKKIWMTVSLEKDLFSAISKLFNAFSCGVTREVVRYKFTGLPFNWEIAFLSEM